MKKGTIIILAAVSAFCVSAATAQTTFYMPVNHNNPTTISASTGDIVRFRFEFERSYCCYIESSTADAGAHFETITYVGGSFGPVTGNGAEEPAILYNGSHSNPDASRFCTTPVNSINLRDFWFTLAFDAGGSQSAQVACNETTLFGGFNTSVTDFNFLELTNTTKYDINAYITAYNSVSGSSTPVMNKVLSQVPAGKRVDVDIHSSAGSGVFGPMIITHDGVPGSLRAVLSQYNITATTPSLSFEPVNSVEFKTRKQLANGH